MAYNKCNYSRIEILNQFYALFLYGGIELFDLRNNKNIILSQESHVIESFAIILTANCIAGMFYAILRSIFFFFKYVSFLINILSYFTLFATLIIIHIQAGTLWLSYIIWHKYGQLIHYLK